MLRHVARPSFIVRYDTGVTPYWSLRAEPRIGYRLYVPCNYDPHGKRRHPLLVAVHGSMREDHAAPFAAFAQSTGTIVLAPVFPGGLAAPNDLDAYKFLRFNGFACDLLLLEMIREITTKYRLDGDGEKFALFGFSGGAQFAHRFLYLHPHRLRAVSLGAPGLVTMLDDARAWWVGTGGMAKAFGVASIDRAAIARVPVQITVGANDSDPTEIAIREGAHDWLPGINDAGPTRIARAATLARSLREAGVAVRHEVLPGVDHDHHALIPAAAAFFAATLRPSLQESSDERTG